MLKKIVDKSISIMSLLFIMLCCAGLFSKSNIAYAPSIHVNENTDTVLMSDDSIAAYWKRVSQEKKKFRTSKQIRDEQKKQETQKSR